MHILLRQDNEVICLVISLAAKSKNLLSQCVRYFFASDRYIGYERVTTTPNNVEYRGKFMRDRYYWYLQAVVGLM